jgi:hypothetical protein
VKKETLRIEELSCQCIPQVPGRIDPLIHLVRRWMRESKQKTCPFVGLKLFVTRQINTFETKFEVIF